MSASTILMAAALGGAIFLAFDKKPRPFAIGAAVVAGVALCMALGILSLSVSHLDLVIGGALTVLGVLLFTKVGEKTRVAAATVVTTVGAAVLLEALL